MDHLDHCGIFGTEHHELNDVDKLVWVTAVRINTYNTYVLHVCYVSVCVTPVAVSYPQT